MSTKKHHTDAQKKALDELQPLLEKHNITAAKVTFPDNNHGCWNGQEWVPPPC